MTDVASVEAAHDSMQVGAERKGSLNGGSRKTARRLQLGTALPAILTRALGAWPH